MISIVCDKCTPLGCEFCENDDGANRANCYANFKQKRPLAVLQGDFLPGK